MTLAQDLVSRPRFGRGVAMQDVRVKVDAVGQQMVPVVSSTLTIAK
jgi:hypothetical protein